MPSKLTAEPGKACPTCGRLVPLPEKPVEPAFWSSVELPKAAPPAVSLEPAQPFMTGTSDRWHRPDVRGLGERPAEAGHGLGPVIEQFVRYTNGDAA
jgi:hypothetical protein